MRVLAVVSEVLRRGRVPVLLVPMAGTNGPNVSERSGRMLVT